MMNDKFRVSESQFLTEMVVREFNYQTGSKLDLEKTVIYSIPPIEGFKYGYEVNTNGFDDTIRLNLYFNIGSTDKVGPFSLEVKPCFRDGVLGDEVYVFKGTVDTANVMFRGYKFRWMGVDTSRYPVLLQTDNTAFRLVNGDFILLQ